MEKAPRVVCLGGGYVASFLCRALQDAVEDGRLDLTVISRDNFQVFHGLVAEMLVGKIEPTTIRRVPQHRRPQEGHHHLRR